MPPSRDPHARNRFRLLTLGGAALVDANGRSVVQQRRRLALLALLAASGERGVTRDKLVAALSPESTAESARHALHQLLYYLRQQTTDELFLGTDPLRLNDTVITSDVADFERTLAEGAPAAAVAFYRGPFLEGFHLGDSTEFEEWQAAQRSRLAGLHRDALFRLAGEAEKCADGAAAIGWWRKLTELDPLDGRAALGLVGSLAAAGDRPGALSHARTHEILVRAEVGGTMDPELRACVARIQAASAAPAAPVVAPPEAADGQRYAVAPAPGPISRPALLVALALVGVLAVGGYLVGFSRTRLPSLPLQANLVAVAPFEIFEPDLAVWREGMVDYLSRNLDGAGSLAAVPPSAVVRQAGDRVDRATAPELARRTGARLVLFGQVVGAGRDSARLRATLFDAGQAKVLQEFDRVDARDRMDRAADSVSVDVVRRALGDRPGSGVRLASVGTRSIAALKEFLQGEQFYRRSAWDSALAHYDAAVRIDSTFALALRGVSRVLDWPVSNVGSFEDPSVYAIRASRHRRGLGPRDSLLTYLDSLQTTPYDSTFSSKYRKFVGTLEDATRRYTNDPEVWYLVGEHRLHLGVPPLGAAAALEAFSRAIALDSGFSPAYEHAPALALAAHDPAGARRYLRAYLVRNPPGNTVNGFHLTELVLNRPADSAQLAHLITSSQASQLWSAVLDLAFWPDSAETAVRMMQKVLADDVPGGPPPFRDRPSKLRGLTRMLGIRGRLRAARETFERTDPAWVIATGDDIAREHWSSFIDLALLGGLNPDSVDATLRHRLAQRPFRRLTPRLALSWWLARGDTAAMARLARRARREAAGSEDQTVRVHAAYSARLADAYLLLARRDSAAALRQFQALPDSLCIQATCVHERIVTARVLAGFGRKQEAAQVYDAWLPQRASHALFVLGTLERARLAEQLGDTETARTRYRFVADIWRHADSELQPHVREARDALVRLGAAGAGPR